MPQAVGSRAEAARATSRAVWFPPRHLAALVGVQMTALLWARGGALRSAILVNAVVSCDWHWQSSEPACGQL